MKLLGLALIFASLNVQASLYCALGEKKPSEYISASPYATLQIDLLNSNQIQIFVTDYYNEIDSTTVLEFSNQAQGEIDGIKTGLYLNTKTHASSELKIENDKILFVLNKKNFTCEIL